MLNRLNAAIRVCARNLIAAADPAGVVELTHLVAHTGPAALEPGTEPSWCDAVDRYLPAMVAQPWPSAVAPIAAPLAGAWNQLRWFYHYPEREDAPGLADSVAFSQVLGPGGPLAATEIRAGFTFMAPEVLYPLHAHPAVELYVVLSGRALWTNGRASAWQDPGAIIVHASEEPHAMQTAGEPLLALFAWREALFDPSRYVPNS